MIGSCSSASASGCKLNRFHERRKKPRVCGTYNFSSFPWFAVLFIACIGISLIIPKQAVSIINSLDIFMLTMAMCALGMKPASKGPHVRPQAFPLAGVLALWLIGGGYFVTGSSSPSTSGADGQSIRFWKRSIETFLLEPLTLFPECVALIQSFP